MPEIGPRCTPLRRAFPALAVLVLIAAAALPASAQPPRLAPDPGTASFSFPEPTAADDIYRAIGDAFGISVHFDPLRKSPALRLELREVDALQALGQLAIAAGDFYKPLSERSILVVADTPQNRRTHELIVIRTFQLAEADPRDVMTLLRSIGNTRKWRSTPTGARSPWSTPPTGSPWPRIW